ncbi:MAG: molybdopterin molybdotransferase MoeA [Rhodospirillaceae bacterium]|nr:molybdopterin molybdotransferase MoeA [Rhodospirillaceae bacterium]
MTQLSDDCFAFGGDLVPLGQVLAEIRARLAPVAGTQPCPVWQATGRVLAADVVADRSVPPHDNSAVDGYAVAFADLAADGPTRLPVIGRASAGHPWPQVQARGTALRVLTGAMMPAGPDTVFMEEDCTLVDGPGGSQLVDLPAGIKRGANRRAAGEDIAAGDVLLGAGRCLRAADVGLLASIGRTEVAVRTPLKVALFSTGDEIREPGAEVPPGCVYDANRYVLHGALQRLGCIVTDFGIVPDDRNACRQALARAAEGHDLVLGSGGMSASEEDHVKAALMAAGGTIRHWRLAIKPGRPVAVGSLGADGPPFVGLPGNPVAVLVTFLMVARPVIARLAGQAAAEPVAQRVRLGFDHRKKAGRREFLRVTLAPPAATEEGERLPVAMAFPRDGAGVLSSMSAADGLVVLAEDARRLAAGEVVDYLPFEGLL